MSSTWGNHVKISIFGGSHTLAIGATIDGLPAGFQIDMNEILKQMARRAPGKDLTSTSRREADFPNVLCGISDDFVISGDPISMIIENQNQRSKDYSNLKITPRPGHADYPAFVKYLGHNDINGGGHFSGRLTAPLVFAGALCRQIIESKGITIGSHVSSVGSVYDTSFDSVNIDQVLLKKLSSEYFPVISEVQKTAMREEIESARINQDSVGGTIECAILGLPVGLGNPMFDGLENLISSIIFGIPAVKGIDFGAGFDLSKMRGSEANDPYYYEDNIVKTKTNHAGGILGGISTGMPVIFKTAHKPTPSISIKQSTVNLETKMNDEIEVHGRHDPCIVPRSAPVVEASAAIAIMESMLSENLL